MQVALGNAVVVVEEFVRFGEGVDVVDLGGEEVDVLYVSVSRGFLFGKLCSVV